MSDARVITGISNETTDQCISFIEHHRAGFRMLCLVTVDHGETGSFGFALDVGWLATVSTDVAIGNARSRFAPVAFELLLRKDAIKLLVSHFHFVPRNFSSNWLEQVFG